MKLITNGDLFTDDADILVCPTNCVGVMGAGLALEFKRRFPWCEKSYIAACSAGDLSPGGVLMLHQEGQRIFHVATKDHWRDPSELEWIESACENIVSCMVFQGLVNPVSSVAVPALGCGLGELEWSDVLPIMQRHFADIDVRVYPPRRDR